MAAALDVEVDMMRLHARFTLVMISIVMFVVAVLSCVFAAQLVEQLVQETDRRASDLAEQVFIQSKYALAEAAQRGLHPDSDTPKPTHDYARHAFEISEGLRTQLIAARENPLTYEVAIVDTDRMVLVSTEENHLGKFLPRKASLSQLVGRSFLHQINVLMPTRRTVNNPRLFEHCYAIVSNGKPFGEVRVIVDSALLVQEIEVKLLTEGVIAMVVLVLSILLITITSGTLKTPDASSPDRLEKPQVLYLKCVLAGLAAIVLVFSLIFLAEVIAVETVGFGITFSSAIYWLIFTFIIFTVGFLWKLRRLRASTA